MKKTATIILMVAPLVIGVIVVLWLEGERDQKAKIADSPPSTRTSGVKQTVAQSGKGPENYDHIAVKEAPAEMPDLRKSVASDPETTEQLIQIISRHPEETERLREENQWIRRREIVERSQSFRAVGKRMLEGEIIEEFEIPLFDGETARFIVDQEMTEIHSERSGVFHGKVDGSEDSSAVLAYYKDADSGFVHMPSRDLTVQYEGWGDGRVIVKDFDEAAQSAALPCDNCRHEGSSTNHAEH